MPLTIAVCIKQVPDSWAEKRLRAADSVLDRESADAVLNELDEYAVEEALRLQEIAGGEVVVVSMGPDKAAETLRKALSMGADRAVHVVDDALAGSDAVVTSAVLAAALKEFSPDVVICGVESTDARMSVVPAMLAERLGWAQLTYAGSVTVEGSDGDAIVRVQRQTEDGYVVLEAATPAVVSVVEKINEPRYPSFKGIMAAKKKPVDVRTLSELGLAAGDTGLAGSASSVVDFAARPPRSAGTVVKDDGDAGVRVAEFLATEKFV